MRHTIKVMSLATFGFYEFKVESPDLVVMDSTSITTNTKKIIKKEHIATEINRYLKSLLSQILTYRCCYRYIDFDSDVSIDRYRGQREIYMYITNH